MNALAAALNSHPWEDCIHRWFWSLISTIRAVCARYSSVTLEFVLKHWMHLFENWPTCVRALVKRVKKSQAAVYLCGLWEDCIPQWCWSLISSIECTCTKRLFLNMCVFSMDAFLRNGICSVFGCTLRRLHSSMVLEFDRTHSIFYLCLMASWVYEGGGRWAFVRVAHLREWGDEEVCIFAIWLFKWVAILGWLA